MMDRGMCWASGARVVCAVAVAVTALVGTGALATTVVYDFDAFADQQILSTQIAGLTFGQTTVLTAGVTLNDAEFPPRSASNVVFDDGGAITIDFATPVFGVGGYFNYVSGLSFNAYDSGNVLLGSGAPGFVSNLAVSGDAGSSPNELVSFSDAGGRIARVVITGAVGGGSFTMDDLTLDLGNTVPEPDTLALLLGAAGVGYLRGGRARRVGAD